MDYHFFERQKDGDTPAGWTVSKKPGLPEGDFGITEYSWPYISLWFVDNDNFDADERQGAYLALILKDTDGKQA